MTYISSPHLPIWLYLQVLFFYMTLLIIHWNINFLIKKMTIMHTLHINFFGCKWPMKKSYQKHWKTILHLAIPYRKKNLYDLTCNFGQLQKHLQHSRFPVLDIYILSPHLPISWHTCGHHIYLFHYTYKFNCFYMKFLWYITIYTCL